MESTKKWYKVKGYEGLYSITKFCLLMADLKKTGTRTLKPRILSDRIDNKGYKSCCLFKDGKRKYMSVHRLVAFNFIDNPENKPCVNHIDGNKLNNNFENLEWCTYQENTQHAFKNGLIKIRYGENSPTCKITNDQVAEIRSLKGKFTSMQIAKKYGLSKSHTGKILKGTVRTT